MVRNYDTVIGACDEESFVGYDHQKREGTGKHLGLFTIELFFFANGEL